ncbi:Methyl-accepting chemotaxis protein [Magnetospirillum sp. LM-5]|uniref:methyl-accepting chemotaxis protein n=1 Tax=Magnetospirillum sp. LM-5 TaxID=2681466 RepID=UPI001385A6F9|nr:methyl-accepting chemotaxis protein [Magnetospirillum sp. LM-5]CAA7621173.1 Methyl-accepting chemotaxis protein [Magnetospirillum sp. LM-5]
MLANRLANTRIAVKVLFAPLILFASMLVLAVIFQVGLTRETAALTELHDVSFANNRFVSKIETVSTRVQSNTYRLLGWTNAGIDKAKIKTLEERIKADIAMLGTETRDFAAKMPEGDEGTMMKAVAMAVQEYGRSAGEVVEMAGIDATTGLILMTSTEQTFDRLQGGIRRLAEVTDAKTGEVYAKAQDTAAAAQLQFYGTFGFFAVLGIVVVIITGRLIARPVHEMTSVMERLSRGDTSVEVPSLGQTDEIGEMAQAVAVFRDNIERTNRLEQEKQAAAAASAERAQRREKLTEGFNEAMEHVLETVMETVRQVHTNSDGLQNTASRASEQGAAVAQAAEQAAANVETVAVAAEQLGSSVQEIARQITTTVEATAEAVEGAKNANATMSSLDESAKRIGEVVSLINTIASQTNLLALNATIEAARAGEAGKGFAVVANEVKSLANQTSKATQEISAQISAVQSATHDAVSIIRAVGDTIDKVSGIVASIASAVEEQSAATQEIVRSVQQASDGTGEITRNIADVSRAAGETGSMAQSMFLAANDLLSEAETLRTEVGSFLTGMRQ